MPETTPRKGIPWLATLVVLAAVGFMVHLGFWQLDRLHQKEAMIARYTAAQTAPAPLDEGANFLATDDTAYHHVRFFCRAAIATQIISGRNLAGQPGWAHVARCLTNATDVVTQADIVLGWASRPDPVQWRGGATVTGVVVPGGELKYHIVADPPLAGLQPNARPDPRDLPNNHLSYAVQWFLFAATALVIYCIALRKRLAERRKRLAAPGSEG